MKTNRQERIACFRRWTRANYAVFASLHRQVKIGVLSVAMSIVLHATAVAGEEPVDTISVYKTMEIEGVGVVGTKADPIRSAMSQTVLFDRDRGAAAPVQTIESALRLSPAIDVRERGGKSVQADISIRGGSFDQTVVMLNGIDFTDARTGHQTHALPVDAECVASIEFMDGIAGVGAYAGAVNIRTMPLRPTYLRIEAVGGEHGYAYGNLSGAVTEGRFSVFAAGSYRRSDGYAHNTDFTNWNGYVRMTCDTGRAGFFDVQAGYQNRSFGSNGFYAAYNREQYEETETGLVSVRWVRTWNRFSLNASASYRKNTDRYDWTRGTAMNYHDTDNVGAALWGVCTWRAGETSFGADYAFNHIYSTNLGIPLSVPKGRYTKADKRSVGNIWLRHSKRWRRFDAAVSAGASFTPYGESALWNIAGGYSPAAGLRIEAGVSQSMRLPTFTDLYYTSPAQVNNTDLVPEKAVTCRLGATWTRGAWSASGQVYYRSGRDIIDWVWHGADDANPAWRGKWHSEQAGRLDTYGAELMCGYYSDGWLGSVVASYGYTATDKVGRAVTSSALDYMKHKAVLSAEFRFLRNCRLVLTGSVYDRNGSYTGYFFGADGKAEKNDDGSYRTEVRGFDPYFLLDARLSWEKGALRLYADMTNITGTDYCDFGGLRLPGRWFTGGIAVTIGGR